MAEKYIMIHDILSEHKDRMLNLKKYYPFFVLCDTTFSQYKEGKYSNLEPIVVDDIYQKPYYTSVGMTDECCGTVYGYASGEISKKYMEDSEEIEVVLADRKEVARIMKEERVALLCAYMMMHFLHDEEPFAFLHAKEK